MADKDGAVIIAFVGSYNPKKINPARTQFSSIALAEEFGLEEALRKVRKQTDNKKLYFLVNSPGGSLRSSFKISKLIRKLFEEITVFVPHTAASGGTLLALTGNQIIMGDMSQLGPIDPQVPYKDYGFHISINSMFRAKQKLDIALRTKHPSEVPYPEKHMAESLDPVILEEFYGLQQMAEEYLEHILKSVYGPGDMSNIKKWLLFRLTHHSYVIDCDLAKDIGINAKHFNEFGEEKWDLMRNWFSQFIIKEEYRHFIRYCIPASK